MVNMHLVINLHHKDNKMVINKEIKVYKRLLKQIEVTIKAVKIIMVIMDNKDKQTKT